MNRLKKIKIFLPMMEIESASLHQHQISLK